MVAVKRLWGGWDRGEAYKDWSVCVLAVENCIDVPHPSEVVPLDVGYRGPFVERFRLVLLGLVFGEKHTYGWCRFVSGWTPGGQGNSAGVSYRQIGCRTMTDGALVVAQVLRPVGSSWRVLDGSSDVSLLIG